MEFENKTGRGKAQVRLLEGRPLTYLFNGKKTSLLPLKQSGVFFSSEDLNAVRGDASCRRKLIDDLVLELPSGRGVLRDFQKILLQKNSFLKKSKKGEYSPKDRKKYLPAVNQVFF